MIRVIAVEREYGSGGGAIAKLLADRLGWQLWDHSLTCEIAKRMRCDVSAVEQREERCDTTFYRLVKTFMRGSYEDQVGAGPVPLLDAEHLAQTYGALVTEIAGKGDAVIVGRGAPYFLRDREDHYSVFIYAPYEYKVERVCRSGHSRSEAEELVQRVDQERSAFVKKYYGKIWPERSFYHAMLNSSFGDSAVVDAVLQQVEALNRAPVHA